MSRTTTAPKVAELTWEERIEQLSQRSPREVTVSLPNDKAMAAAGQARMALAAARREARSRHDGATMLDEAVEDDQQVIEAREAAEDADAQVGATAFEWTFRPLPPHVYDEFMLDFPPSEKQQKLGMEYDPLTYTPAIIAACSVNPIAVEKVAALIWGSADQRPVFNQGEVRKLSEACKEVNEKPAVVLGKVSRVTRS